MATRRILAEVRRNLQRGTTLTVLVTTVVVMGIIIWLGGDSLDTPIEFTYYLFPMAAAPYAAYRVGEDRRTGFDDVVATTPLSRAERLAAQAIAVLTVPALAVLATTPVLYALAPAGMPEAFVDLLAHLPWAMAIATPSAAAGLLVAHLTPDRPRLGLGLAFALVPLWFTIGGLHDAEGPGRQLGFLGKLSPFSYADHMWRTAPVPTGSAEIAIGPLAIAGLSSILLVPIVLGLQDEAGWRRPLTGQPIAFGALLVVAVGGLAGLAAWEIPTDGSSDGVALPLEDEQAGLHWEVMANEAGFPLPDWGQDTPYEARISIVGPPNGTVELTDVRVDADVATFQPRQGYDTVVTLDRIINDTQRRWNESGGDAGTGQVELVYEADARELFVRSDAEIVLLADDEPVRFTVPLTALSWETDGARAGIAALATFGGLAAGARWLPARWNRW